MTRSPNAGLEASGGSDSFLLWWRLGVGVTALLLWEVVGRMTQSIWISLPSLILGRLSKWAMGDIYPHILATCAEMLAGLFIGCSIGAIAGFVLGRHPAVNSVIRPILVAFYSVPLIAIAPLLIVSLGIEMAPKIVLVAFVTSFIMLSTTATGVASIDEDLVDTVNQMGSTRWESTLKVVVPATLAWVVSGLRVALPNALVAASVGEMLAARRGVGFLLMNSANNFDVVGLYAALSVMLILGLIVAVLADRLEYTVLRWRHAGR